MLFKGSITALITPFADDALDEVAYRRLIEWQIEQGTHGLVPCGTTGESPTLSHDEHRRIIEICIDVAAKRVPVMAGCGSNCTQEAVALVRHAESVGADAVLVVTPYYNKPNQEGLYRHFATIAAATPLPLFIYNIPSRSVIDMKASTLERLRDHYHNIVGVKDASNDMTRPMATRLMAMGNDFCQLSGEDATIVPFLAMGGVGCISVTSNIAPKLCADLHNAWQKGDWQRVDALNCRLFPLHKALFIEPNPVPVKYAAALLGLCRCDVRLPLVEAEPLTKKALKDALTKLELIA